MTTTIEPAVGVTIREAATALGVSPNAVRMRIRHKTLAAFKDGEQWRVILNGHTADAGWSPMSAHASRPTSPPTSASTDHPPVNVAAQAQLALVIREAVAPFIEELGKVQHRLGAAEQELIQERERRQRLEHEYEVAKREIAGLRMLSRSTENKRHEASERPAAIDEAEIPPKDTQTAPGGAGEAERASEVPRRCGWFARLFGWE